MEAQGFDELGTLVAREKGALRHLVALAYRPDPAVRAAAVRGVALASRHHPKLVQETLRRLVWAMNEEAGTNAAAAPEVFRAVAEERPELVLPMLGDLTRLARDPAFRDALTDVVRLVAGDGTVGDAACRVEAPSRKSGGGGRA